MKPGLATYLNTLREPGLAKLPWLNFRPTVVIIGGGPSSAQACRVCGPTAPPWVTIACNTALRRAPDATYALIYASAAAAQVAAEIRARRPFATFTINDDVSRAFGISLLRAGPVWGLSRTPGALAYGHCCGHGAIDMAAQMGAGRIVLLGFEMDTPELAPLAPGFTDIASELRRAGVEVLNATPHSRLDCFERIDFDHLIQPRSES